MTETKKRDCVICGEKTEGSQTKAGVSHPAICVDGVADSRGEERGTIMTRLELEEKWEKPIYRAEIWWCGDDHCDCHEPRITIRTPNFEAGYPWVHIIPIWNGTFSTNGEGLDELKKELENECANRGLRIGDTSTPQIFILRKLKE